MGAKPAFDAQLGRHGPFRALGRLPAILLRLAGLGIGDVVPEGLKLSADWVAYSGSSPFTQTLIPTEGVFAYTVRHVDGKDPGPRLCLSGRRLWSVSIHSLKL